MNQRDGAAGESFFGMCAADRQVEFQGLFVEPEFVNLEDAAERFTLWDGVVNFEIKNLDPTWNRRAIRLIFRAISGAENRLLFLLLEPDVAHRLVRPKNKMDCVAVVLGTRPGTDDWRIDSNRRPTYPGKVFLR